MLYLECARIKEAAAGECVLERVDQTEIVGDDSSGSEFRSFIEVARFGTVEASELGDQDFVSQNDAARGERRWTHAGGDV